MPIKRINTQDRDMQLIQDNVEGAISPLQSAPLSGGIVIPASLVASQDNLISHNLGRRPMFYLISIPNVQSTIWSPVTSSLSGSNVNSTYINLRCSTTCTVSLWIK